MLPHGKKIFALCLIWLMPIAASAQSAPSLIIGEINWAGSSRSSADEWIELWNLSPTPQNLAGYVLKGASDGSDIAFPSQEIPAYGTFIVSNYDQTSDKTNLATNSDLVTTSISLSNSSQQISLLDPSGAVIDTVGDGTKPEAGSASAPKTSMVRSLEQNQWINSQTQQNLKSGSTELMTPGFCDGCEPVSEAPTSAPSERETPSTDILKDNSPTSSGEATDTTVVEPIPEISTNTTLFINSTNTESTIQPDQTTSTNMVTSTTTTIEMADLIDEASTTSVNITTSSPLTIDVTNTIITVPTSTPIMSDATTSTTSINMVSTGTVPTINHTTDTVIATSTIPVATSAPIISSQTPSSIANPTITVVDNPIETTPTATILLNEILPNPNSGSEWIELKTSAITGLPIWTGYTLSDDHDVIFTFGTTTMSSISQQGLFILVELKSSHLNNDGDQVILKNPQGIVIDHMSYPNSQKGESWIRQADQTWIKSDQASPLQENPSLSASDGIAHSSSLSSTTESTLQPVTNTSIVTPTDTWGNTDTLLNNENATLFKEELEDSSMYNMPDEMIKESEPALPIEVVESKTMLTTSTKMTASKTKQIKPKTTPKKKTATAVKKQIAKKKNITPPIPTITIDMLDSIETNIRVRVSGMVGSTPALLGKNKFTIHNQDGRGLFVQGNGKQPTPPLGSWVTITGTLTLNDDGIKLSMKSTDHYESVTQIQNPIRKKEVDLLAPSQEDAWAFTEVTGTVTATSKQLVQLDVDGIDVTMRVKPSVKYRTERLNIGDTVHVQAVIDTRGDLPIFYPREAADITIVKTAIKPAAASKAASPPWIPYLAAGSMIGLSQGLQKYRQLKEKRRLEQIALKPLVSPPQT